MGCSKKFVKDLRNLWSFYGALQSNLTVSVNFGPLSPLRSNFQLHAAIKVYCCQGDAITELAFT